MRAGLFVVAAVLLASCGGGGGGGGGIGVPALVGTYTLTAFTVIYDNGSIVANNDVASFSGTLTLRSDGTVTQVGMINGTTGSATGTWSANAVSLVVVFPPLNCSAAMGYVLNGTSLTTDYDHECSATHREIDIWTRTDVAPAFIESEGADAFVDGSDAGLIGRLLR